MMVKMLSWVFATLLVSTSSLFASSSYYPKRLDDAKAIYLTAKDFPVHGDGVADDSDAVQQAINKVQETTNQGADETNNHITNDAITTTAHDHTCKEACDQANNNPPNNRH